jgi:tetratricopeptide (TPR) repeat protein
VSRTVWSTLLVATAAQAQPSYEDILDEARAMERETRPGEQLDVPLERAYQKLAEAAQLAPGRWEAFALRGVNRCASAVVCRHRLTELMAESRARGEPEEVQRNKREAGLYYIDQLIAAARHDFAVMERNMRTRREVDPGRIRFAAAALKYARGEYLESPQGPGAIDDFKALMKSGWNPDRCSEFVARCYVQLGNDAAADEDYIGAQKQWDEAARWARTTLTQRVILTNKAAAYDLDNEFGLAEKIIRAQIAMEPGRPAHWKNLGMMLGHQNLLRAALPAYRRARELCRGTPAAVFHGNAWLKPAMIHGKLLEEDGDLRLAWRLFLEYRAMLGDDYNFCVNFGEFAFHLGQYELSWQYLVRARDLQPFCIMPYQLLLMTALRLEGPREEVEKRIEKAREDHREAMKVFRPRDETAGLRRVCAGLRERTTPVTAQTRIERIEPDPLAGYGPDRPPPWVEEAAAERAPFDPDRRDEAMPETSPEVEETAPESSPRRWTPTAWIVAGAAVLAAAALFLVLARRPRGKRDD